MKDNKRFVERCQHLIALYNIMKLEEKHLEKSEARYAELADKMMAELQEHPFNGGRKWEREDPYHRHCDICEAEALVVARKVVKRADRQ